MVGERWASVTLVARRAVADKTHGQNDMREKGQKPVSGSGGKASSSKDQKSASGGKADKHDGEKAQKQVSGSKSVKDEDRSRFSL